MTARKAIARQLKRIPLLERVNAFHKGRLQERQAARDQQHYDREASCLGLTPLTEAQLGAELAERLAGRGIRPSRRRIGDLHIFLAYHLSNWEAALPRVLSEFGEVSEFEWRGSGFRESAPDWLLLREAMNRAMLDAFLEAHRRRPVDAVVGYVSGGNTRPSVLQEMAGRGAVIFNFCWDDKLFFRGRWFGGRWEGPAALAAAVDLNLTNAPDCVIKYRVEGGLAMFWPEAADPQCHRPYDCDFEFDVSFIGAKYGGRPRFTERLRRMGIAVTCFGSGWERGTLTDEEMVRLYSRSRINLGFGGVGYSTRLTCLKGRDFEVPMSGGLYLTQHNPELALVYRIGDEIVTYRDEADCAQKIRHLLVHPDEAQRIRLAGRARALRDHTWQRRFEQIFSLAGILA